MSSNTSRALAAPPLHQHAHLAHHFDDIEQQREAESFGMWIFLATEAMIFGAMFISFSAYRSWYPHEFEKASAHLNLLIGGINTIVLLTSSFTMALAVYAVRTGRPTMLLVCLGLTILLGLTFLGLKAYEYYDDYLERLVPILNFDPSEWTSLEPPVDPGRVQLLLWLYYIMTGTHAVHMTVGLGLLIFLVVLALRRRLSTEHYMPVEVCALYWHFVDIIWIFLLPLLYLTGQHTLSHLHF